MDQETVDALVMLGLERGEAEQAVAEHRVALALVSRLLVTERGLTVEEAAAELSIPVEYLVARDDALGLPPDVQYSDQDVEELRPLVDLLQLLSPEAVLRSMRADAQALTRIAMSNLQLVNAEIAQHIRSEGGGDVAVALALAEAARTLMPATVPLLSSSFRRILTHLLSTEIVAAASRGSAEDVPLTVGFIDVVGYTSLSARIDPDGLDEILEAFESRCYAMAGRHEGVQLVKFLGDAAMYISVDPVPLAHTLLEVVEGAPDDSPLADAPMKGGMAAGPVLARGGDYFGPPVNMAARLTDHARPGAVLADEHLRSELAGLETRRVPPMRLRGLGLRRPIRVREAAEPDGHRHRHRD